MTRISNEECQKLIPNYDIIKSAEEGDYYDEKKGNNIIEFIEENCKHSKGEFAGKFISLENWQRGFLSALYGWMRKDGTRRFRNSLLFIPRKNGKTILCACIGLYDFFCGDFGSEAYIGASTKEQATICWNMAHQMIIRNPHFKKRANCYRAFKSFEREDGSIFRPVPSDGDALHGLNATLGMYDETHTYAPEKGRILIEAIDTSMGTRREPLTIHLTTSDSEREGSICNEMHDYASKVRDGIIDDHEFLPVIYELSRDDDWTKEENWFKANPNLGVSIKLNYLKGKIKRAIESPTLENGFKRLHLNIMTEQDIRWLKMSKYDECDTNEKGLTIEDLRGRRCFAGLDLASVSDLLSFSLIFPDDYYCILNFNWLPKLTAHNREEKNGVSYLKWARDGHINLTEGNVADYDIVRQAINDLGEIYNIEQIAIDRWNAQHLVTKLGEDGFDVVPFGQGFKSMSAPTKEFERLMLSGRLCHFGQPVLRWAANNASAESDSAGNIKISKKKSSEKIDPMVATIMALGLCIVDEGEVVSVYEERGLFKL